jgi:hypothetical protein
MADRLGTGAREGRKITSGERGWRWSVARSLRPLLLSLIKARIRTKTTSPPIGCFFRRVTCDQSASRDGMPGGLKEHAS